MKSLLSLIFLTLSLSAISSDYVEAPLANCDGIVLLKVTVSSQEVSGAITQNMSYVAQVGEAKYQLNKVEYNDVTRYEGEVEGEDISIMKSFEFFTTGARMTYRMNGEYCEPI